MLECPECGYRRVGYDGYCERCETLTRQPVPTKKPHYRNKSLDDLRGEIEGSVRVTYKLPPDEPRVAVSHDDYMEFLRRMQTRPMTESEVADLVIRRLERVAAGKTTEDEEFYEVKELRKLSDAWLSEAQENRIRSLVLQYASR